MLSFFPVRPTCHSYRGRTTLSEAEGSKDEWRKPDALSCAMPHQGVLSRNFYPRFGGVPVGDAEFVKRKEIQFPQERLVGFSSLSADKEQTPSMLSSSLIPLTPVILTEVRATLSEAEGE
jgi:hypothetical protein